MKPDRRAVIAIWTSIAVIACTAVYAAKVYEISFQNEFKTGSVDIKIEQYEKTEQGEKLIDPGVVMPNQDVSYICCTICRLCCKSTEYRERNYNFCNGMCMYYVGILHDVSKK